MFKPTYKPKNITTNTNKYWSYDEYYVGDANNIGGSTGYKGENYWTGAKSLESYVGAFLQGTMHGRGEYRWRYYGEEGTASTYEGYFYANQMHGYGTFSYEDGTVFDGLFFNNHRWGPGILYHPNVTADVGIWWGHQLVRLAWSPPTAAVIPNLNVSPMAAKLIAKHRIKLRVVEDANNAAEVTTHETVDATANKEMENSILANSKTAFFNKKMFDRNYYDGVHTQLLEEISAGNELETPNDDDQKESPDVIPMYNAWNNSCMMVALMKHCYEHDRQRDSTAINLEQILSGPRRHFKPVATQELNCRTLLMASFLGHTSIVAQLVIDSDVHPNIADVVGNTALMYATRGDKTDTIDFLMEAGAKINDYNDSGCTALGIALIRFVAVTKYIHDTNVADFITPPNNLVDNVLDSASDWNLNRYQSHETISSPNFPSISKINSKKIKSSISMKSVLSIKKRQSNNSKEKTINENEDIDKNDLGGIYKALHKFISQEYLIRVSDIFGPIEENKPANIFDCVNMIQVIEDADICKNNIPVKNINSKTTKEAVLQNDNMNRLSGTSIEQRKIETLAVIRQTILMLLAKGANPKAVIYPLPSLLMAVISSDADLVKDLLKYGADIHQTCPEILNYTALEYAIAQPLTNNNLEVIKALLEGDSKTNECLHYEDEVNGPTLLHAVLAKTVENDLEKDVQIKLINLLLDYGSDSASLFKGQSAVGVAITKYIDLLAVFINNPKVNLNAVIDDDNHTILAKIFDFNFFITIDKSKNLDVMLLNLLKYGANPLLKYSNDLENYKNIFVFINKQLMEIENSSPLTNIEAKNNKGKTKNNGIPKNKSNALVKNVASNIDEFKKAVEIMSEFSRNAHKRWLQADLTLELIEIVKKFKHRSWHMIIKEHKQKKQAKLWLTAQRCLEIWSILWVNQKICNDRKVLELLLCIVHCYNWHRLDNCNKITFDEKTQIEKDVKIMMKNYVYEEEKDSRSVVKPELGHKKNKLNSLCFECSLPLSGTSITCPDCQVVSFCQIECVRQNKERNDCHPCGCEGILQDYENKMP